MFNMNLIIAYMFLSFPFCTGYYSFFFNALEAYFVNMFFIYEHIYFVTLDFI